VSRARWTLTLVVGSAALLLAAGCGSDGGSADGGTAAGPAGASGYRDCLREHGVDIQNGGFPSGRPTAFPSGRPRGFPSARPSGFPSGMPGGGRTGGFRPEGIDEATWQKAQEACASLRPTGGPGDGNRGASAAYRNCLSDHGVDLTASPSTTDPKAAAAMRACAVLRPSASASPTP